LTGVTVTTGAACVVSVAVCFFVESTAQAESNSGMRASGKREAGSGKRENRDAGWGIPEAGLRMAEVDMA
jgi:2-methylcitrate dehydratase PrpD